MIRKSWFAIALFLATTTEKPVWAQAKLLPPVPLEESDKGVVPAAGSQLRPAEPLVRPLELHTAPADAERPSGLTGGAAIYYLRPYINNNVAFVTTTGIGTSTPVQNTTDFEWDFQPAGAVWAGWTSPCGPGLRGRYFYFNHDSETARARLGVDAVGTTSIAPPAGVSPSLEIGGDQRGFSAPGILLNDLRGEDFLTFKSALEIQSIDLEATYACNLGSLDLLFSVGGRYLQLKQNYFASLVNFVDDLNNENSRLDCDHNFHGAGPTLGCQATWRIPKTNLATYGLGRASFLVGKSRLTAVFSEVILDELGGDQNNLAVKHSQQNLNLPILELEGGVQYQYLLRRSLLYLRGACVHQTYFDAGGPSSRGGNLSLFGAQLSLGLLY
ncbi:MAG: Lpg1974 family pore-forming outer membrane protein [Gemmataceae bacterium]|nr:Lpg1974 family pore-forming outer membrane protein [Gemmataceae bacterium]